MDPVLMLGWPRLGLPAFGLNGTAYATIVSQLLTVAALVAHLRRQRNLVAPSLRLGDFDARTAAKTAWIALPIAVQYAMISLGLVVVTGIVNGFGELAAAAFGCATTIDNLAFMPAMAFNQAVSAMAGQNFGANRPDRAKQVFWWGCLLSGGITLMASALAVTLPASLIGIFMKEPAVISLGVPYLRVVGAAIYASRSCSSATGSSAGPDTRWCRRSCR